MAEITTPSRQYVGSAQATKLVAPLDSSGSTNQAQCESLMGWPSGIGYDEFVATIGRGTPNEERVLCSSVSGTTLIIKTRGWDDTLQVSHEIGETVEHTFSATDAQDANDHITSKTAHGSDGNIVGEDRLAVVLSTTDLTPPGVLAPFGGDAAPTGWKLCDGSSLSSSQYPKLFAAIGYKFGGSGGTFNLPNMAGRFPVGRNSADTQFDTVGETGGSKTTSFTIAAANLPVHTHTTPALSHSGTAVSGGGHTHTVGGASANHVHDDTHSHGLAINANGTYAITAVELSSNKAGGGSMEAYPVRSVTGTSPTHTHTGSTNSQSASSTGGHSADHSHSVTAGGHSHTMTQPVDHAAGVTGNGGFANTAITPSIIPPFVVFNWIIKVDAAPVTLEAADAPA